MKKINTIAITSMMALIMSISLSSMALAREAESGGGDRGESGRSSTHVEPGDDRGGLRVSGSSDDSGPEVHRSSETHASVVNNNGALRGDGTLDDNHDNRRGAELSGSSSSSVVVSSTSNSTASIQSRIAELIRIIEGLLEQLRRQASL